MDPALLADVIVVFHLAYVAFALCGEAIVLVGWALGWAWVRNRTFRAIHLVCVVVVPLEALADVLCPLTAWEHDLRRAAGQDVDDISFVGRLARDLLFFEAPPWVFTTCYVVFGLLVIATLWLVPPRRRQATSTT
jgi:hypothetical protein